MEQIQSWAQRKQSPVIVQASRGARTIRRIDSCHLMIAATEVYRIADRAAWDHGNSVRRAERH
jgi:fructose/tagatose bisphosphate aldolase